MDQYTIEINKKYEELEVLKRKKAELIEQKDNLFNEKREIHEEIQDLICKIQILEHQKQEIKQSPNKNIKSLFRRKKVSTMELEVMDRLVTTMQNEQTTKEKQLSQKNEKTCLLMKQVREKERQIATINNEIYTIRTSRNDSMDENFDNNQTINPSTDKPHRLKKTI